MGRTHAIDGRAIARQEGERARSERREDLGMEVKEGVKIALKYVADAFSDAKVSNLGLEEVIYDDHYEQWRVTVGFSRPWDYPQQRAIEAMTEITLARGPIRRISRTYKVVEISDSDGQTSAIEMREVDVDEWRAHRQQVAGSPDRGCDRQEADRRARSYGGVRGERLR